MSLYRNKKSGWLYEFISKNSTTVTLTEPGKTQEIYTSRRIFDAEFELYLDAPQDKPVQDNINSPTHYTAGGIETIDFIEAKELGYNLGNAVKYISRAGKKGDAVEDLKKARWYIERQINNLEQNQSSNCNA